MKLLFVFAILGILFSGRAEAQTDRPVRMRNSCSHPIDASVSWFDPARGIQVAAGPWAIGAGAEIPLVSGAASTPVMHRNTGKLYVHAESSDRTGLVWTGPNARLVHGVRSQMFEPRLTVAGGSFVVELKCPAANPPGQAPLNTWVPVAPGTFVETISRDASGTAICNYPDNLQLRAMTDGRSTATWTTSLNFREGDKATLRVIYGRNWTPQDWVNFNDLRLQIDGGSITVAVESLKYMAGGAVLDTLIHFDGQSSVHSRRGEMAPYGANRTGYFYWLSDPDLLPGLMKAQKVTVTFWLQALGGAGQAFDFDVARSHYMLQNLELGHWRCP